MGTTSFGALIVFYFRFPYLDRRAPWINNYVRYDIKYPTQIFLPQKIEVLIENISKSGLRLKIVDVNCPQLNFKQFIDINLNPWVDGLVPAELVAQNQQILRIKFGKLSSLQKAGLDSWIQALKKAV